MRKKAYDHDKNVTKSGNLQNTNSCLGAQVTNHMRDKTQEKLYSCFNELKSLVFQNGALRKGAFESWVREA